jgi:cell division cycle 20-like protein 1 (cofactor of APC complex)
MRGVDWEDIEDYGFESHISGDEPVVRPNRRISKAPYKVLDAPDLQDDFYLNLVDWSSQNILAVGLGRAVYIWSAHNS